MIEHAQKNALVGQKNYIITLINEGHKEQASLLLDFTRELWQELDYHSQWKELTLRLEENH